MERSFFIASPSVWPSPACRRGLLYHCITFPAKKIAALCLRPPAAHRWPGRKTMQVSHPLQARNESCSSFHAFFTFFRPWGGNSGRKFPPVSLTSVLYDGKIHVC